MSARQLPRRLVLTGVVAAFLSPIAYLVSTSLRSRDDVLSGRLLPRELFWQNWPDAFETIPLLIFVRNSVVVAVLAALVTLLIGTPAAYALARFRVGGRALPAAILSSFVAPPVVAILPLFFLLRALRLTDSLVGLALVNALANVPVAVWLLDSFVRRVPIALEESAWLDGCGRFQAFVRIVVPLITPGIVAVGIICTILSYNELLFAITFAQSTDSQTLTVGISLFEGDRRVQFGQQAAASLVGMVPVYAAAVFFQRWLVRGLTAGSVR